ncbi:DUF4974 domain-containing protein [Flammeovirgaceae bacterium SG7u.111]|nr:DUF4974 domain-containing protein [Flammeovirgaceae bacterium SG7u.132]WPO33741.1 DUF4974 domain-containing protein [Flammeovirgaceae bacterium SG7u.111]
MKYKDYTILDFLKDDLFIKWAKHADEEATDFWNKWLLKYPEKKVVLMEAKYLVQNMHLKEEHALSDFDYVGIFENIFKTEVHTDHIASRKPKRSKTWLKIAAVFLPLIAVAAVFYFNLTEKQAVVPIQEPIAFEEKAYPNGIKASLILSDESKIKVNAASTVKFPKKFADNKREFYLEGEAFFEIAKDSTRPFVITSGKVKTTVLGTSFNIRANETDPDIVITVATGKVSVTDEKGNVIILYPYEKVTYNKVSSKISKIECKDLDKEFAWKDDKLIFEKASLTDVFAELEKWYGVNIEIEDGEIKGTYSGVFKDATLKRVLEGISYTSNFKFKTTGNTVTIKKN